MFVRFKLVKNMYKTGTIFLCFSQIPLLSWKFSSNGRKHKFYDDCGFEIA